MIAEPLKCCLCSSLDKVTRYVHLRTLVHSLRPELAACGSGAHPLSDRVAAAPAAAARRHCSRRRTCPGVDDRNTPSPPDPAPGVAGGTGDRYLCDSMLR